jgi:hypothetical protein
MVVRLWSEGGMDIKLLNSRDGRAAPASMADVCIHVTDQFERNICPAIKRVFACDGASWKWARGVR